MRTKAEIRDLENLSKQKIKCLIPLGIWSILLFGSLAVIEFNDKEKFNVIMATATLVFLASIIIFIPMVIVMLIKANRGYKTTWITKEFDFQAINGKIYLNDKKLHVNYNKKAKKIYIHDMGDYRQPYKATFYATINEPDIYELLQYIEDHNVQIEKENLPRLKGKYGSLAPLSISQYRR